MPVHAGKKAAAAPYTANLEGAYNAIQCDLTAGTLRAPGTVCPVDQLPFGLP